MVPSSPSSLSLAACLLALVTSPHDVTSFPLSRIPLDARPMGTTSNRYCRSASPLHSAVDMPMRPMEEEREKDKKKNRKDDGKSNSEDQKEWKQVVGGFVPKFLKRDSDKKSRTVQMVDTLEDYKRVVVDEQHQIVVVRFYAPWCKSCKAANPHFKKMASQHKTSVKFVEVPLTKETAYIHEGLGVESIPYGHIYHPEVGLVEEKKINRKVFKDFRESLDSYVRGSCDLPMEDVQEDSSVSDGGFQ
eukprot:CAMPEP_0172300642 /NCGR_PEP_ID=MMETSP1058-20130122/2672_1 /TAXON_ID=83371 /ORGANISM="Detonula confervacea, Strain CCMP 353" /LENGTH=245 /DNA_ID=CAMNT_0013010465 /DNA_START=60 /DNA_END=797 /DNA_ORIENTATION=+